ncbi:aminotransferase [Nitzschia inconspicua]|uniref:Branched-chain-amino-acid aminotransferase n=1 Tax=Nitzschia inconspicua TaxID=303405 RepID=A0A9K3LE34_9STRA|nr:aminotransferase [Nitzschia inconspicua]
MIRSIVPFAALAALFLTAAEQTQAATRAPPSSNIRQHSDPKPNVDWDSFGFSMNGVRTDYMWLNRVEAKEGDNVMQLIADYSASPNDCLSEFGTFQLSPAATVLNYGQALFEGLKAFRRVDGSIALFRPERNAERMQNGAKRFLLPPVPTEVFVSAADAVVRANSRWVPPFGKGALYLRPLLMGTGDDLGVKPSWESTFCIYCCPVGNYFKGGLKAIRLQALRGFSRAAQGGAGHVKASGNYAPAFFAQRTVKQRGFDDLLCLDAATGNLIEEAGASNFFAVFPNNTIVTPCLNSETILPGVTRVSIIELAVRECGCTVVEGPIQLSDLHEACEAFCCGTGASVTPVGSVSVAKIDGTEDKEECVIFGDGTTPGPITQRLYNTLLTIQTGTDEDLNQRYAAWIHVVEP